MGNDARCGIVLQRSLDDFTRMNRRLRQRAGKHGIKGD